jgi:mannose-6-phosphate isomerase
MNRIRTLRNPIRHYAWGSHTALAEWTGRPSPSQAPEAELWLGAHPSAPSRVEAGQDENDAVRLDDWIGREPKTSLGEPVASTYDDALPFLFKVLAPAHALSIQTHPDAARAYAGFARENAAGLPIDHPERSYRDPKPKPELICALTRFSALCGFRERRAVAADLQALELAELKPVAQQVETRGSAAGLGHLLGLEPEAQRGAVRAALERLGSSHDDDPKSELVHRLNIDHPEDIGVLSPYFLHAVELEAGEALYLKAGLVHAYLEGLGIEIMGNSDNTLRGGLTARHVDVPEFLDALDPAEHRPEKLLPTGRDHRFQRYRTSERAFSLSRFAFQPGRKTEPPRSRGPEIWLCTAGRITIHREDGSRPLDLARGQSAWIPAAAPAFRAEGDGVVHTASVPD